MTLACREHYGDAGAFIATARLDFGGQTAPRAAQSLCGGATVFLTRQPHADAHARWSHRERGDVSGGTPPLGGAPRAGARYRAVPSGESGCTPRPSAHNPLGGRARGSPCGRDTGPLR
jgi:hypothetical protein